MKTVVFCGPTVGAEAVQAALPGALCRPPAAQGDVAAARSERPDVIALIDGVFLDVPSVWHREILAAIDDGIVVVGAASMGALRAAECRTFGMMGFGKIFEAYASGIYAPYEDQFEDDDEVAVTHGPPETGYAAVSDAMVDLRETLARAHAAGAIDRDLRDRLVGRLKHVFFADRSFALLPRLLEKEAGAGAHALASAISRHRASQKCEDALALLAALARGRPEAHKGTWRLERTDHFSALERARRVRPLDEVERRALDALYADEALARRIERRAAARLVALDAQADPADAKAVLSDLRLDRDLLSRSALDGWARANGLSQEDFARVLADEAKLAGLADAADPDRLAAAMVDELRLDGLFPNLVRDGRERA